MATCVVVQGPGRMACSSLCQSSRAASLTLQPAITRQPPVLPAGHISRKPGTIPTGCAADDHHVRPGLDPMLVRVPFGGVMIARAGVTGQHENEANLIRRGLIGLQSFAPFHGVLVIAFGRSVLADKARETVRSGLDGLRRPIRLRHGDRRVVHDRRRGGGLHLGDVLWFGLRDFIGWKSRCRRGQGCRSYAEPNRRESVEPAHGLPPVVGQPRQLYSKTKWVPPPKGISGGHL